MISSDLSKDYPWARIHSLDYPVRLDALGEVLAEIRASHGRTGRSDTVSGNADLVGNSADTEIVRQLIEQVAPSLATVLISGESGTGKEVVARQIHQASRRKGPFIAVNCGAIPEHLLESELFGHERGAFTGAVSTRAGRFEQAKGGTFFLDEIGDMPTVMQVKLLRVLEERVIERVGSAGSIPVDVRLVAATHRDLPARIEAGKFREDLYYRLSVFPIEITPLRDRPEDIPLLVDEFIRRQCIGRSSALRLTSDALQALQSYQWPGNVRELANLIERLVVIKPNGVVDTDDLPWPIVERKEPPTEATSVLDSRLEPVSGGIHANLPSGGMDLKHYLAKIEQDMIHQALAQSDGVVQRAAELLGVARTTLVEKIRRYQLKAPKGDSH